MLVVTRDALVGVKYGAARNTPDVHLVYTLRAAARPHRTAPHGTEKMMDEPRQFSGLIQSKTPGWVHATPDRLRTKEWESQKMSNFQHPLERTEEYRPLSVSHLSSPTSPLPGLIRSGPAGPSPPLLRRRPALSLGEGPSPMYSSR
jgi:hypothetical protein